MLHNYKPKIGSRNTSRFLSVSFWPVSSPDIVSSRFSDASLLVLAASYRCQTLWLGCAVMDGAVVPLGLRTLFGVGAVRLVHTQTSLTGGHSFTDQQFCATIRLQLLLLHSSFFFRSRITQQLKVTSNSPMVNGSLYPDHWCKMGKEGWGFN